MKKYFSLCLISFFIFHFSFSQTVEVYPSNWWVGMKWNKVQLMVYGKNISDQTFKLKTYPGVTLLKVNKVENPNYVFLDLQISSDAKPGKPEITAHNQQGTVIPIPFELKSRRHGIGIDYAQGVTSKDLIY